MAWVGIAQYSLIWNANSNIGTIGLWFVGTQINPNVPHQTLSNLRSDQYVAIIQTLRDDADHKAFFDRQQGLIASGIEPV